MQLLNANDHWNLCSIYRLSSIRGFSRCICWLTSLHISMSLTPHCHHIYKSNKMSFEYRCPLNIHCILRRLEWWDINCAGSHAKSNCWFWTLAGKYSHFCFSRHHLQVSRIIYPKKILKKNENWKNDYGLKSIYYIKDSWRIPPGIRLWENWVLMMYQFKF